jgi:hypothetical protein
MFHVIQGCMDIKYSKLKKQILYIQSSNWKFELTDPDQILEFIFIYM